MDQPSEETLDWYSFNRVLSNSGENGSELAPIFQIISQSNATEPDDLAAECGLKDADFEAKILEIQSVYSRLLTRQNPDPTRSR